MTDESNGESTFEFVDTKSEECPISTEPQKSGSTSNSSSTASVLTSLGITSTENLLMNISPPMALPSFVTNSVATLQSLGTSKQEKNADESILVLPSNLQSQEVNTLSTSNTNSEVQIEQQTQSTDSQSGENNTGNSLFSWVKQNVVNSTVLSKVAEKAKNSVNSMITTLDPQMREFIYSGGDVEIIVASDKEIKIAAIREAFQNVFGKATVTGVSVNPVATATQPVGFDAGIKAAEERIALAREISNVSKDTPIVAVENFLLEVGENKWYDLGVILLNDPINNVNLQTFTQMTPVPSQIVTLAQEATPKEYPFASSGLLVTVGSLMAQNLQVPHSEWHYALTGVSRRDIICLAAQSLVGIYKNTVNPIQ